MWNTFRRPRRHEVRDNTYGQRGHPGHDQLFYLLTVAIVEISINRSQTESGHPREFRVVTPIPFVNGTKRNPVSFCADTEIGRVLHLLVAC